MLRNFVLFLIFEAEIRAFAVLGDFNHRDLLLATVDASLQQQRPPNLYSSLTPAFSHASTVSLSQTLA